MGTDHQPLIPIINGTDLENVKTPRQIRLKERLMRWDLKVTYIQGKNLGGTEALSRYGYGVCNNNEETVNWISMVSSKLADKDNIAPWLDKSICAMSTLKQLITQNEITSMTAFDKTLTELRSYIVQGFPETMARSHPTCNHSGRSRTCSPLTRG